MTEKMRTTDACDRIHLSLDTTCDIRFDNMQKQVERQEASSEKLDDAVSIMSNGLAEMRVLTEIVSKSTESHTTMLIQNSKAIAVLLKNEETRDRDYIDLEKRVKVNTDAITESKDEIILKIDGIIDDNSVSIPTVIKYVVGIVLTASITLGITMIVG